MTDTITVEPGTIFASSWGYDETRVDYYEVVALTPSGKSVKLRRIASTTAGSSRFPKPGVFVDGPTLTKRLNTDWKGKPSVRINSYSWGYFYDPETENGLYDSAAAGWQR